MKTNADPFISVLSCPVREQSHGRELAQVDWNELANSSWESCPVIGP